MAAAIRKQLELEIESCFPLLCAGLWGYLRTAQFAQHSDSNRLAIRPSIYSPLLADGVVNEWLVASGAKDKANHCKRRGPRTMSALNSTSLTLSIDLELEIGRASASQLQWLDDLTPELVALLDSHGIAATWAVADPARSAATEAILSSSLPHEISVLGDRSWLGWGAGGLRAKRELTRRISGAAARQIAIRTLVLHNESSFANGLQLGELGVQTIRQPIGHEVLRPVSLIGLANGLAMAEQVQRLVLPNWWNWWEGESQLAARCRQRSLLPDRATCHLGLDAQQLCTAGPRGLYRLANSLAELSELRTRHGVQLFTLRQWSERRSTSNRRVA